MKFLSILIVLILRFLIAARDASLCLSDESKYDPVQLSRAYYSTLSQISVKDAERFERLLASFGDTHGKKYRDFLDDMVRENRVDDFKCMFPLIHFAAQWPYDIYLMLDCVKYGRRDMAEYIFMSSYRNKQWSFVWEVRDTFYDIHDPENAMELLEWIGTIDPVVAERKCEVYSDALWIILENGEFEEAHIVNTVTKLIRMGAEVSETVLDTYKKAFPFNDRLQCILRNKPAFKIPEYFNSSDFIHNTEALSESKMPECYQSIFI